MSAPGFAAVLHALRGAIAAHNRHMLRLSAVPAGSGCALGLLPTEPSADDLAMESASLQELVAWCDDLQDRVGLNVAGMRAAVRAWKGLRLVQVEVALDRDGDPWVTLRDRDGAALEQFTCDADRVSRVIGQHLRDMMQGGVK